MSETRYIIPPGQARIHGPCRESEYLTRNGCMSNDTYRMRVFQDVVRQGIHKHVPNELVQEIFKYDDGILSKLKLDYIRYSHRNTYPGNFEYYLKQKKKDAEHYMKYYGEGGRVPNRRKHLFHRKEIWDINKAMEIVSQWSASKKRKIFKAKEKYVNNYYKKSR
jgi:hypothetical protein